MTGEGKVPTTANGFCHLIKTLHAPKGTKIGLETGTQAMWVARLLSGLGMQPMVIDAREVRQKARRMGQKCDRRDAFEICDGIRRGLYTSIVYVPEPEVQRLRQILSRRRHFVSVCSSQVNAAKFLLRSVGQTKGVTSVKSVQGWQRLLGNCAGESVRSHLGMHGDLWPLAREKVLALEEELNKALKPFEEVRGRLETAPGVGVITAATFIAVPGTPHRFPDSGRVVSYIGLIPSTWDPGDQQRHGHITRRGSAALRAVLCEAAHHAASKRHPLNPYFARVCAKQGYKRAIVAVAQRLARILFQMWRKGESFDETQLNVVAQRRTRTKTFYWRIKRSQEQATAA